MKRIVFLMLALCAISAAQPNCDLQSLRGTYAASRMGWLTISEPKAAPVTLNVTVLGLISIGYNGTLSGVATVTAGVGPAQDVEISGTVAVNANCTGTLTLHTKAKGSSDEPGTEVSKIIILPEEKQFLDLIVDMGPNIYPAVLGTWKRMTPLPTAANF